MIQKKDSEDNGKKKNVFVIRAMWILVAIGIVFSGFFLIMGFSMWFVLWLAVWASCIGFLWRRRFVAHSVQATVIGLGVGFVLISFILFDMSIPTAQEMQKERDQLIEKAEEVVQDDTVKKDVVDDVAVFMEDMISSVGEAPGIISPDDQLLWTAKNMSLKPQNAYSTIFSTTSNTVWSDVQQYIMAQGSDHGTIGFTFEDRSPHEQVGYIIEDGKYTGLMCILTRESTQITIGCGWGP
jgi:hypothetical protein